jgi:putative peptidoglycan lipid II flippase
VPLAIIGVSYSLAAFPTLTRHFANKNMAAFSEQMATTARHIIFWSMPVTALFIVLRAQIVRVILGSGQFDWAATRLTAAALALFVISCVFQSLMILFVRAFYSTGHTKKPFYINLFFTIVLIGITYALVKLFYTYLGFRLFISSLLKVEDLPSTAVLMLPLGYSIGTMLNTVAHWIGFERDFPGFTRSTYRTVFESISASVLMGAAAYIGLQVFEPLFGTDTLVGLIGQSVLSGGFGILFGLGVLHILGSKELEEGFKTIRAKFWKTKIIATDPDIV